MHLRQSVDNLTGNAIQQLSGVLVFLIVPAVLGVEEYGQAVFVVTLWSFQTFSDLGFSHVYSRRMPAFHEKGDRARIAVWDATILKWRLAGAAIFGVCAAIGYIAKYGHPLLGVFVAGVAVFSTVFQFCIAQATVKGAFREVRDINLAQAAVRLLMIPCVLLWSLPGWFIGQLVAAAQALAGGIVRQRLFGIISARPGFDWRLIRENFGAALLLGMITGLWGQSLSVARLVASFRYPDAAIATYGLVSAGYQIVMMTFLSIYAPISIRTYAIYEKDPAEAIRYVTERNRVVVPAFLAIAAVSILAGPPLLRWCFPAYALDNRIVLPFLMSLLHVPAIIMFGSLLISAGKFKGYLTAVSAGLLFSVLVAVAAESRLGTSAAAVAQFVGLGALVVLLYLVANSGMPVSGQSRWRLAMLTLFSVAAVTVWATISLYSA